MRFPGYFAIVVLLLFPEAAMSALLGNVFAGTPPSNLGVHAGKLTACPASPNCVCSQATDGGHRIAPLAYNGDAAAALARLARVIANERGATIVTQRGDYIYATFQTPVMGFVDDAEFLLNAELHVIQVRSASRMGYGDFGVNRKRIEALRATYAAEAR